MMSVAFVLRMFRNVFVQIRVLGVCLVATNVLENAMRDAVIISAKCWLLRIYLVQETTL